MEHVSRLSLAFVFGVLPFVPSALLADEWQLTSPVPYQVVQRQGFIPAQAHEHQPGGPALGHGLLPLAGNWPSGGKAVLELRVARLAGATGRDTDWTPLDVKAIGETWRAAAEVPAGGWYKLEVRARRGDQIAATTAVEPVGVGEIFLIAGQSYATGANDELTKVTDPTGRIAAYDSIKKTWRVANDPQPNVGDGGTIWPPMADQLLPLLRVPIGLVNVAVGGTASRQWLPGESLYENLAAAGNATGRFRAVLWQQGESDVIERIDTDTYVQRLVKIRAALAGKWGFEPPWLLAKSTLHPTVYDRPEEEGRIRAAIDQLWGLPGFRPGPDTDILGGENRGGMGTRRHFSAIGQQRAGWMWSAQIWCEINRCE
jgi:hypothetical protein